MLSRTSRNRRAAAAVALTAIAALTMTACDGHSSSGRKGKHKSSGSSSKHSRSQGLAAPTRTSGNPTPTAAAATAPRCHTSGLRLRLEPGGASVAQGQYRLALVLTNTSGRSCTLQGFPGVDLKGPADTVNGPTYSLRRQAAMAARVTLRAGQSAGSQLTYLVGDEEAKPWKPTTVVLTPPNETTQLTVAWTGNSVLRQDGATHPGSYIGPMQAR
jgi:hypothetical protein